MELTEAKEIAQGVVPPARSERVWLEQALGRVLAENLYADRDIPGEARAQVDGFAIISSDTTSITNDKPCVLRLQNQLLAAGDAVKQTVSTGYCFRILTGASLPENADAVVAQEEIRREDSWVIIKKRITPGDGVVYPGSDIRKDRLLLAKGAVLTPTRLALIAAFGYAIVSVGLQPRIALLATGNELKEIGEHTEGPYSYCNNRYLMAWSASLQGAKPIQLGIATDEPELIAARLKDVEADLIVSTGGVGHGDRDFIPTAWKLLGVEILFDEVNLVPGRRTALGIRGKQIYFGLPGTPWGAQVAFEQLAIPILHKYQGIDTSVSPSVSATLESTVRKRQGINKVVRGTLQRSSSKLTFSPVKSGNQQLFTTLHNSLSYILLESHVTELSVGSEVQVCFHDFPLLAVPLFGIESAREGYYA